MDPQIAHILQNLGMANKIPAMEQHGLTHRHIINSMKDSDFAALGFKVGERITFLQAITTTPSIHPNSYSLPPNIQTTAQLCACVGCNNPVWAGYQHCGKTCASGGCGHSHSSHSAPLPPPSIHTSTAQLCACVGCNKPVWAGYQHCGKTCASGGCGHSHSAPLPPTSIQTPTAQLCACVGCNKPVWSGYQHCGKTCASGGCGHVKRSASYTSPTPSSYPNSYALPPNIQPQVPTTQLCSCVGCNKPVWSGHQHCGKTCASGGCGHVKSTSAPGIQSTSTAQLCACVGCNKPVWAGYQHCGKTCASGGCGHSRSSPLPSTAQLCACVGCNKPVWSGHQHCGKTCASGGCGHVKRSTSAPSNQNTCSCVGCNKPVWSGYQHCGKTCASRGCGHQPGPLPGANIVRVPKSTAKYSEIEQQFTSKWGKPTPVPTIKDVYEIVVNPAQKSVFEAYQQSLSSAPRFGHAGVGNTLRRFHGTKVACSIGQGSLSICSSANCSVCRIIDSGFLLKFQGSNTGWGRFGRGLYFTSTSGKANDYTGGTVKAMFIALVVAGKGKKLYQDDPTLTSAPAGYDSVIGEVGGSLNYDEIIVYSDSAAIPRYLIIYG